MRVPEGKERNGNRDIQRNNYRKLPKFSKRCEYANSRILENSTQQTEEKYTQTHMPAKLLTTECEGQGQSSEICKRKETYYIKGNPSKIECQFLIEK